MAKKKAKSSKSVETANDLTQRAASTSKVYLCGNCYSKLSGMYITSLDASTAKTEWNAIPYIQKMYNANLIGYSTNQFSKQGDSDFIPKDSGSLTPGEVYFPIYEDKTYALAGNAWRTTKLESLATEYQYVNSEMVALSVSIVNKTLNEETPLALTGTNSQIYTLLKTNHNVYLKEGDFSVSAILNGNTYLTSVYSTNNDIKVTGIKIVPRPLTEEAKNYKSLMGQFYAVKPSALNGVSEDDFPQKITEIMMDLICNNSGNVQQEYLQNSFPIKTPYLFRGMTPQLEDYYRILGYNVTKGSFYSQNPQTLASNLNSSSAYPNVSIRVPTGWIEKYEATISPKNSGWYKLVFKSDDYFVAAIDNVLVAFGASDSMTEIVSRFNYLKTKNNTANVFDSSKMNNFLSDNESQQANYLSKMVKSKTNTITAFNGKTTNDVKSALCKNTIATLNTAFASAPGSTYYSQTNTVADANESLFYVSTKNTFTPGSDTGNPNTVTSVYFSNGPYIFLRGGQKYKFRAWHGDHWNTKWYIENHNMIGSIDFNAVCIQWHGDSSVDTEAKEIAKELTLHKWDPSGESTWTSNATYYPSISSMRSACADAVSREIDKMDSSYFAEWKNKGYELIPSPNYYQQNSSNTNFVQQIFTVRDLTAAEKNALAKETALCEVYQDWNIESGTTNPAAKRYRIFIMLQQYLCKGPVEWL